ncbi:MAG: hypothetical protein E7627_01515 [Ruminococcaceae bacterium]|nr:hypothetical protein [Oscillospiraceae bacterium]
MGFGILIFGYFLAFAFSISQYYFFTDIIGAVVMLFAFSKLSEYNRYYIGASYVCLGFLLLCSTNAASMMFAFYDPTGPVDLAVDIGKLVSACVMHVFIFLGIRGITMGAEAHGLAAKAQRNMVMTGVYYLAALTVILTSSFMSKETSYYLSLAVYFYWLISIVMNLVLIYNCFGKLCPADEDENEKKRSRFAIVNKFNDMFDELESKKQARREESMRLALEEAEKRAAEKAKKHPHNKKKKK